jgi:flagellar motor switch protein FliN/FliY
VPTLDKVTVDLMVVLGTTSMPIHQVMRLSRGAIIELDATEADEVKILANNLPIASGVVLVDRNRIAVEVKQMLPRLPVSLNHHASRPCPSIIDLLHRRR